MRPDQIIAGLPTISHITLNHPSFGMSPAGFSRIHAELLPKEVGRLVGYDPRVLVMKPKRPSKSGTARGTRDLMPANVSQKVIDLQNKVQRSIDTARVATMVQYLHNALATGAFADWGAIELVTTSKPDMESWESLHTINFDSDSDYFIADGQHRYCAILDFCRDYPQFAARFTQSVTISVLPESKMEEWAGQAFHDRNYYAQAVRAGKALSVDSREPVNALTKQLSKSGTLLALGGIAMDRDTLLAGDTRFTSHTVLHRFVKGFLYGRSGLNPSGGDRMDVEPGDYERVASYLQQLAEALPWAGVERDAYLARSSAVMSALAVIGHDLAEVPPEVRQARVASLARLDWRRSNLDWVGVLGSEKNGLVQPGSSRPAIDGTIRYLRVYLGIQTTTPTDEGGSTPIGNVLSFKRE